MTINTFNIKKGDTLPVLSVTLQYSNGSAIDLTNGSTYIHIGNFVNYVPIFSGACVITNAINGEVEYRWTGSGDTNSSGIYWVEFKTTWPGSQITLPNNHSFKLEIFEEYE
jgi:hypothetical protein